MTLLFSFKKTYLVQDSFENVHAEIKSILRLPWYDYSENIAGKLYDDGSFRFWPKWTFASLNVIGFPKNLAYLTCTLKEEESRTYIQTIARPNYTMVTAFYLMIIVLLAKLIGINTYIDVPFEEMAVVFLILGLVLAALMVLGAVRLRKRFERLMQLK